MSNTAIQIKRSEITSSPGSLQYGELAYSFNSGKLFIGTVGGAAISIGGNTYNQMLDSATSSNTANQLVKRDGSGSFSATTVYAELQGNAATASKWETARDLGLDGDVFGQATIDGSTNANTTVTLKTVNVNVGSFGGATNIPTFTVNEKGLITAASNVSISTSLSISGDTGSETIDLLSETLKFVGGDGIESTVSSGNTVSFAVDNTVIRTTGGQIIDGSGLSIHGNLVVTGNTILGGNVSTISSEHYVVTDPMIYLAGNNYTSDIVSIGFAANYFDGVSQLHTGLFREPQSNSYYLFTGVTDELSDTNYISPSANGFTTATLIANISGGTVSGLTAPISVADGGLGFSSVSKGDIIYANNSNSLSALAASANGNVLLSGETPSWGKVNLTNYVSDVLRIENGGTNSTATPTAGGIAYGNGSSYLFTTAGSSGQALISSGTSAPSFGVLGLSGGGLGFTSAGLNANSAVFYSGGNSMSYTNSASDGNVLQYSTSGGIQFGMLDGGTF